MESVVLQSERENIRSDNQQQSCKLSHKFVLEVLEKMLLVRFSDEKMAKLVRQNKGGTFHLAVTGHEMIGVVAGLSLNPGVDWALPYYRDRSFAIGLGCSMEEIFAAFLAKELSHHSGGRMMPEHFSQKNLRILCQSSVVGSQFLHAAGVAKSIALKNLPEVAYVSGGDGSTSQGDFHEMLNFSCLHKLPLVCVIQDNGWAISVPVDEQTTGKSIAKIAKGYEGLNVFEVDGCDIELVTQTMRNAVHCARNQMGPALVVAKVPRIAPHSSSDDPKKYKSEEDFQKELEKDPLKRLERWVLDKKILSENQLQLLKIAALQKIENACIEAEKYPNPEKNDAAKNVFKDFSLPKSIENTDSQAVVMMDALNHALIEEMHRDHSVVVFGEDVAKGKGGVFGITKNLSALFGDERVFNTPLAESTIVGISIGMSMTGYHKPVAEIQFADYLWTGINQLFNELASMHYRSNGHWHCPVVLRMPCGGYIQGGPYHSQSIEAYLAHCPGLKIAIPSNASDAKRMLKAAILDPNPVIFLEHKALYRQRVFSARAEPGVDDFLELGKACIVKEGSDVTFVGWGMTVLMGSEAADILSKEGVFVEVIDVCSIVPLDFATILTSVKKTGKLMVAHEAVKNCGFGAEIAARISEEAFRYLDAPIVRLAAKDCPVPYSKDLEDEVLPQKNQVLECLRNLAMY